jgi:hypothetical protein
MTPRRITAEAIEILSWDHAPCCKAPLEFEGSEVHLTLSEKHGGHFTAQVEDAEVCS